MFIAGEVFFRFRPRRPQDGLTVPLQLQMLPSEMLPLNRNEVTPGGNVIRQGIEFDAIGRRVAYHFLRRHPGDMTDPGLAGEIVRIPASEIVHVIDPVDAGQLRGVSRFAAGIVKLFLLDQYDDAELDRKKVAAMHALFITTPAPAEPLDAAEGRDENDERTIDLQPGQITMLEPGEEVQTSAPADVGQTYEPFQYRTLLQVSAALGVPYAYLSNDMLKANYSNSRLALLEFRRRIEAYQHAVIVWQLCRQVWARWMDTAVLAGALELPDYDERRREYLACCVVAAEVGLGRSAEGCARRDRADRCRPQEPHAGAGRARLRRRAGRCRDCCRQGAGEIARPDLRIGRASSDASVERSDRDVRRRSQPLKSPRSALADDRPASCSVPRVRDAADDRARQARGDPQRACAAACRRRLRTRRCAKPIPRRQTSVTVERIAVVSVVGTLVGRSGYLDAASGLVSYADIGDAIAAAMADPTVRGVILDVDSPGGEVGGLFDLVEQIGAIKARASKPLWAVANENALSAAYAIASAADRLYVTRTGEVGSIGVVAVHVDESGADAKAGLAWTFVFAGERKVDGNAHEPLSERARATIQADVDRLYGEFCTLVAANRRLDVEAVRATDAAIYRGELAVRAGLADRVGTLDLAIAEMATELDRAASMTRITANSIPKRSPSMATNETEVIQPNADQPPLASQAAPHAATSDRAPDPMTAPTSSPAIAPDPAAESRTADRLRAEFAEIATLAAQAARLGVTVDAADAMRKGISADALRRSVLDTLATRAEATSIVAAAPSTPAAGDSPIVRRAKERAAAARAADHRGAPR